MAKPFVKTANLQQSQPIVDKDGRPVPWFVRLINDNNNNVTQAINQLAALPDIQAALQAAQTAAANAQAAANSAQQQADAIKSEASLTGSYIEPDSVITATPTAITIASHTRYYADGTSVPVNGGTVATTGPGVVNYVFYDDPDREGGAVPYQASTAKPVQTGDTHVVGAVNVPATGTASGGRGPLRPGEVEP